MRGDADSQRSHGGDIGKPGGIRFALPGNAAAAASGKAGVRANRSGGFAAVLPSGSTMQTGGDERTENGGN